MSNEANNAAHNPGTFNFFSAGKSKPGGPDGPQECTGSDGKRRGDKTWSVRKQDWNQKSGNVRLEKSNGSKYVAATWCGLSTDAAGNTLNGTRCAKDASYCSNHQFVFSEGAGEVDAKAKTARIAWKGTVTVNFYSGSTYFFLADPVLDIEDGAGTLSATLSGVGGERPGEESGGGDLEPTKVVVATLPNVDPGKNGFTTKPAYDGVRVGVDGMNVTGAFPQTFISALSKMGMAPFWYDSGSSHDPAKKALPLTVSYDASEPVKQPDPPKKPPTASPTPEVTNEAVEAPSTLNGDAPTALTYNGTTATSAQVFSPADPGAPGAVSADLLNGAAAAEALRLVATVTSIDRTSVWLLGVLFFALAASTLGGTLYRMRADEDDLS